MKTLLSLTLLILMSSTLVSCSGGKSETKLEISRGLLVSSSGFDGGLIVSGKNSQTGQAFTKSLTTGLSVSLYLDAGPWTITAIGWDGDPHTPTGANPEINKPFAGKPSCGKVSTILSSSNPTVNLAVTQATCGTADFAGSHPDMTNPSIPTLPKLKIVITCNSFFTSIPGAGDNLNTLLVDSSTAFTYCTGLPEDLKSKVKSMRIHSLDKNPDATIPNIGISSGCIEKSTSDGVLEPMKTAGPTNPYRSDFWELRLPLKGVPLFVTLFEETTCTKPVGEYVFNQGLESKNPDYDSELYANGSDTDAVRLYLPGSDLRRAKSSFLHVLPFFKDSLGNRFGTTPAGVSDNEYHAYAGQEKLVRFERQDCGGFSTHTNVSGTPTCIDEGDHVTVKFTPASTGSGTVNFSSGDDLNFRSTATSFRPVQETLSLMWKLTGSETSVSYRNFFDDGKDNYLDDDDYGILSRVRSMLLSNGAGGLLGIPASHFNDSLTFSESCMANENDKTVQIFNFDEAKFETYRAKVSTLTTPSATNNFMCDDTDYDSDCTISPNTLKKRMVVWDYQTALVDPVIVLEFDCDKMVGSYESKVPKIENGLSFVHRSKLNWNTTDNNYQRMELLEWSLGTTSGNAQRAESRSMYRIQKDSVGDYYAAWGATFRSLYDGTSQFMEDFKMQEFRYGATNIVAYNFLENGELGTYENLFATSTPAVVTVRGAGPVGYTANTDLQNEFTRTNVFPQTPAGSTTTDGYDLSTYSNNGDKVFGMMMSPASLNSTFKGKFGTSFYTNP